jgi:hypothetical protein
MPDTGTGSGRTHVLSLLGLLALLWPWPAAADYQSTMEALTKGLPPDARALVHRIVDCNHWGGEEPYDAARKAEIETAMTRLDCNNLSRDEAALRRRYAANRAVLDALDRAHKLGE